MPEWDLVKVRLYEGVGALDLAASVWENMNAGDPQSSLMFQYVYEIDAIDAEIRKKTRMNFGI